MDANDVNSVRFDDASPLGEGQGSLVPAVVAGMVAALIGGGLWAGIVWLTGYEVGYAALGLGALVGFAMSRSTTRRDTTAAVLAAVLALAGLVTARVVIAEVVMPSTSASEVMDDPDLMVEAALLDLEFNGGFPADLQAEYDAILPGELIPDDTYERMWSAAESHASGMTDSEREVAAAQFTSVVLGTVDTTSRVTSQLSLFDLLWVFLALSTAWRMMSSASVNVEEQESSEAPAPAEPA